MKIFNGNSGLQEQNKVCLNQDIKKISRHLSKAGKIIGDDDSIVNELKQAQSILNNLILGIKDPNTHLVYFIGTPDEFLKKGSRIKKENIEVICDNDEDMKAMTDIIGIASQAIFEQNQDNEYETGIQVRRKMSFLKEDI